MPDPVSVEVPGTDPGRLTAQLRFVLEVDRLKSVTRRNLLVDGSRRENSAEHSWYLALSARVFAEYAPPETDIDRVTEMLLIHDVVEVDAGDTFIYGADEQVRGQQVRERAAADRIFSLLPEEQALQARAVWDEFEARETPEARFARAIDRIAPMLANAATDGGTWTEYNVSKDQVLEKVKIIAEGSPQLGEYARGLIEDAATKGYLADS
ncbi:HD domain-containing protein [Spiractinospora alimapuensis]|uniref:HD domain-containing protein n=1 Tax=Spiractinospora alimapuensis TaxID=2820884 RepID=UPI001F159C2B|nr:HD domain-containing protein [Spiractinospora alimapuensis]QVQ50351.1 HD domain-containing protein [Spiractinospora alimapuensis]